MSVNCHSIGLRSVAILSSYSSGSAFIVVAADAPDCVGGRLLKLVSVLVRVDAQVELSEELASVGAAEDAHSYKVDGKWDCNESSVHEDGEGDGAEEDEREDELGLPAVKTVAALVGHFDAFSFLHVDLLLLKVHSFMLSYRNIYILLAFCLLSIEWHCVVYLRELDRIAYCVVRARLPRI